ncbi:hypothetical protein [Tepidimicrobium xylanilyticum]|uniref:hypothetical protein n=1 Tax=Tepidimicrobium xylanilyticum TaxID=1123352 RepID=UPI0026507FB6|nr:hypothetical protein [Tepidimicrobium xylanilyticum]GMG96843.1 hypothetical protein EN5CB1_16690 [Tepidimicrobium xylanilyticum]
MSNKVGRVVGYIFNDEAQSLLDELVMMRDGLKPGEWFSEIDRERYENLNKRLNVLMGRKYIVGIDLVEGEDMTVYTPL